MGGPDGGNGGRGGSVIVRADEPGHHLADLSSQTTPQGVEWHPGAGALRHGKNAQDLVLTVPTGTVR